MLNNNIKYRLAHILHSSPIIVQHNLQAPWCTYSMLAQYTIVRKWKWLFVESLQMQCISKLPNAVHSCSQYGVVAARLTTEWPGSVVRLSKRNTMLQVVIHNSTGSLQLTSLHTSPSVCRLHRQQSNLKYYVNSKSFEKVQLAVNRYGHVQYTAN